MLTDAAWVAVALLFVAYLVWALAHQPHEHKLKFQRRHYYQVPPCVGPMHPIFGNPKQMACECGYAEELEPWGTGVKMSEWQHGY